MKYQRQIASFPKLWIENCQKYPDSNGGLDHSALLPGFVIIPGSILVSFGVGLGSLPRWSSCRPSGAAVGSLNENIWAAVFLASFYSNF